MQNNNNKEVNFFKTQKGKITIGCITGAIVILAIILIVSLLSGSSLDKKYLEKIEETYVTGISIDDDTKFDTHAKAKTLFEKLNIDKCDELKDKIKKYNKNAEKDKKIEPNKDEDIDAKAKELKEAFKEIQTMLDKPEVEYKKDTFKDKLTKIKNGFKAFTEQKTKLD